MTAPLNVFSKSTEPLGRAISNFAHTPFELDGIMYASIEAFYTALKFGDLGKRMEIAPLYGSYAKSASKGAKVSAIEYGGKEIAPGSPQHHALIARAIRAKFEQDPELMSEFVASRPRPLAHDTGHVNEASKFPAEVFIEILTELREEFAEDGKANAATEQSRQHVESIEIAGGKSKIVLRSQARSKFLKR